MTGPVVRSKSIDKGMRTQGTEKQNDSYMRLYRPIASARRRLGRDRRYNQLPLICGIGGVESKKPREGMCLLQNTAAPFARPD